MQINIYIYTHLQQLRGTRGKSKQEGRENDAQSQKKQENLAKKRKTKCFHVLQTFKGDNVFLLSAVLKGLVGP